MLVERRRKAKPERILGRGSREMLVTVAKPLVTQNDNGWNVMTLLQNIIAKVLLLFLLQHRITLICISECGFFLRSYEKCFLTSIYRHTIPRKSSNVIFFLIPRPFVHQKDWTFKFVRRRRREWKVIINIENFTRSFVRVFIITQHRDRYNKKIVFLYDYCFIMKRRFFCSSSRSPAQTQSETGRCYHYDIITKKTQKIISVSTNMESRALLW